MHPLHFIAACYILSGSPFFPVRFELYWNPFPSFHDWDGGGLLHFYYLWYLSFYSQGAVALLLFETRRKDFVELAIHHVVTIFLIVLSYISSNHRIGLNVMIVHDFSDMFLYVFKAMHYLEKFGNKMRAFFFQLVNVGFGLFAIGFFLSRNLIFPIYIIWPAMSEISMYPAVPPDGYLSPLRMSDWAGTHVESFAFIYDTSRAHFLELSHRAMCVGPYCISPHYTLTVLMLVLEVLHIFWFLMIVRMAVVQMFKKGGVQKDIRSDDEEDNEEEEEFSSKKKK